MSKSVFFGLLCDYRMAFTKYPRLFLLNTWHLYPWLFTTYLAFVIISMIIAERSKANNRDIQGSKSQLAFIYIYMYIRVSRSPRPPGQATGSKWRLVQFCGCCLQTPRAETGRVLDKFTTQLYQVRLTTAPRLVQFV